MLDFFFLYAWAVTSNMQDIWSAGINWYNKHTGFLVPHIRWLCFECLQQVSAFRSVSQFYLCWFSPVIYINKHCRALSNSTTVEIDGEDAREFITGLADNIGLENIRAARMVSAAVAARTRSCFLQAWVISHTLSLAFVSFFFFLGSFVLSLSFSLWGDWLGAVNARSPSSGLDSVHV